MNQLLKVFCITHVLLIIDQFDESYNGPIYAYLNSWKLTQWIHDSEIIKKITMTSVVENFNGKFHLNVSDQILNESSLNRTFDLITEMLNDVKITIFNNHYVVK